MKLYYHINKNNIPNFGDALNSWVWPKLIGDYLDDDDSELFVGFGTIINERLPRARKVHIFSSGYGYQTRDVEVDPSWNIHCLRGPLTEEKLGVSGKSIVDGAVLVSQLYESSGMKKYNYSYMPHIENAHSRWASVCYRLGIHYIDPSAEIEQVLDDISASRILIAEAMHGAIVADALHVPWIAVKSSDLIDVFKWQDFCLSLKMTYSPHRIPQMSPLTKYTPLSLFRAALKWWWCFFSMKRIMKKATANLSDRSLLKDRIDSLTICLNDFKGQVGF